MRYLTWAKTLLFCSIFSACFSEHLYSDTESLLDQTDYAPHNDHDYYRYGQTNSEVAKKTSTNKRHSPSKSKHAESYYRPSRPGRHIPPSSSSLQMASSNSEHSAYPEEFGGYQSAGHYQQQHYGHYHGGANQNAVGLLGFLTLLYLIQNVLNQMTTTRFPPAPPGRRKRSVYSEGESESENVIRLSMPLLNAVSEAGDRKVPMSCVRTQICTTNRMLVQQMGDQGRMLGNMLTVAVGKILKHLDKNGHGNKMLAKAGFAGRSGAVCEKIYKPCKSLGNWRKLSNLIARKASLDPSTVRLLTRIVNKES